MFFLMHTHTHTQTGSLQMIEMYKGHKDKFALFEGSLSSGSELYVLQVGLD